MLTRRDEQWLSVLVCIWILSVLAGAANQQTVNVGEYTNMNITIRYVKYSTMEKLTAYFAVTIWGEDGPGISSLQDADLIDCSNFGHWNFTINLTVLYVQEKHSLVTYQKVLQVLRGPQHFTFLDSSVGKSSVVDAILDENSDSFDPNSFLVLQAEENQPLMWCCHIAGNTSVVSMVKQEQESSGQLDIYSYLTGEYRSTQQLENSPCPPPAELTASKLGEWRKAKERQAKVLLDITSSLQWDYFLVIYQNQFEQQVRFLTQLASNARSKILLAEVEKTKNTQNIMLRYFETSPDLNIVLITSANKAQEVLQMAQALEPKIGKRISVTSLSRWLFFCQEGIIHPDSWMFSSNFDNIALVSDAAHLGPGHPVQVKPYAMFVLTTLLYKTGRRELASVGSVLYDWKLQLPQEVFPNIKFGFNGRLFLVTTLSWTPYVYRHVASDGNVTFSGFCMDMADELSRTLNFTIQYTEPEDGFWGVDEGNGTWNGLVGQVAREEVDMVIAPIGITEAREGVIDFTSPFFYDDSAVILKKPDPNASKWRTYIDIFRQEVLWCVFAALLGGFAVLSLLVWAEMKVHRSGQKVFANSYFGSFLYLYGAMLAQGGRNLPKSAAGRVFLSSWWLFCIVVAVVVVIVVIVVVVIVVAAAAVVVVVTVVVVVVVVVVDVVVVVYVVVLLVIVVAAAAAAVIVVKNGTYSGNLIAVLTVPKDKPPFNTLKEMAAQNEYRFGTLKNSMWTELFKTSPRPEFQSIARRMEEFYRDDPDILHVSTAVHLEKVKRGGYAYIADKGLFSSWLATNCDLILLKEKFFPGRYGIVLPNNSVYTKVFSDQVVKFYESGLLQVWVKKWWPQQTFCQGSLLTEARALSLVDMQSSFYVLAIGLALSAIVLVLESGFSLVSQLMLHPRWPGNKHKPEKPTQHASGGDKMVAEKPRKSGLHLRRF
ncbi:glutamate receptor [Elysia marginata]|uniref:Glutamate receptor n=1 Tax=Elysia marginata TaxID=1093978 RepID=A0AAV4JDF2_9GAST|nr:glutamate receptor [Elysia marginata]